MAPELHKTSTDPLPEWPLSVSIVAYKDQTGSETDFCQCGCLGKLAETMASYVSKGAWSLDWEIGTCRYEKNVCHVYVMRSFCQSFQLLESCAQRALQEMVEREI